MRIVLTISLIAGMAALMGCEASAPSTAAMQTAQSTAPPPPQPAAPAVAADNPEATADSPASTEKAPAGQGATAEPEADAGNSERATVGAGAKGRDYGGPGFVTTPIEALFRADDLIVFETHIPNNMKIYKAEHDNKGPKTHEEFMQVIIKDGGVRLPELPAGDEYWYDPKTEQLMVRHPKPEQP
jgi:hypothetical protein